MSASHSLDSAPGAEDELKNQDACCAQGCLFLSDSEFGNQKVAVPAEPEGTGLWAKFKVLFKFLGPAFFIGLGYMDPGNWATDIEAGSRFGYKLMWVLLMSNLMGLLLQVIATRVGVVSRKDLAQLGRDCYPRYVCIPLWLLCETAIIATDLAEVLGTAIGIKLLCHVPLLVGVLLTLLDTLLFLLVQRYGIRKLEAILCGILLIISSSFIAELFLSKPSVPKIFKGFLPQLPSSSIFVAVAIIGAVVMPHNFYLHSSLVQSRVTKRTEKALRQALCYNVVDTAVALNVAFFVNSSILIVSAAVFWTRGEEVTKIEQAPKLLEKLLNSKLASILFGIAMVCSGQASTVAGTLAGQIVMEGFLELRIRPWIRQLLTRSLAIAPAVIVILVAGDSSSYKLLLWTQVILSMQLPFAVVPLLKVAGSQLIMGKYKLPLVMSIPGWLAAALAITFNCYLLGRMTVRLIQGHAIAGQFLAGLLLIPFFCGLLVLLGYLLLWRDSWIPEKQRDRFRPPEEEEDGANVPLQALRIDSATRETGGSDGFLASPPESPMSAEKKQATTSNTNKSNSTENNSKDLEPKPNV